MIFPERIITAPGRLTVSGAPEGVDALVLAELARHGEAPVLHTARDDTRLAAMADALAFFAPDIESLRFPAWDCLPYDRISPHPAIMAERLKTLSRLAHRSGNDGGIIVLTTVNAALQRVPTPRIMGAASLTARKGDTLAPETVTAFLAANGYTRTDMVVEPGDFAVRGGLIDVFPPGAVEPRRLDFFGDTLDQVRSFDPASQRTTGTVDAIALIPASEVTLDEASIARFRQHYMRLFGAVTDDDPLYEAVREGRKHQGMEHWLPLFYDELGTLFDYLPTAMVSLDHLARDAADKRQEQIADYYGARREQTHAAGETAAPYKPVPPESLYLQPAEWSEILTARPVRDFSPYDEIEGSECIAAGGHKGRDFAPERAQTDINVYDALKEHVAALAEDGRRILFAAYSDGARERLLTVLGDHGIAPLVAIENWREAQELPGGAVGILVLRIEHGFEIADIALITEQDVLGDRLVRTARRRRADNFLREVSSLAEGDLVVHVDHGIGQYKGLVTLTVSGAPHDCLMIEYAGGDKLYVPVENLDMLSRYGSEDAAATLDKLGGTHWQMRKARVKNRLKEMAEELIKIAAERHLKTADIIQAPDGMYHEFCARFPYHETDDQSQAIDDVMSDLATGKAMDRLICGDVGFGKTEVALRSAFAAVLAGHQVAVITPTTLLCRQHFQTFRERFAGLPVTVRQLSRLVPAAETKAVKAGLTDGTVDIVIGTHALLGKGVRFKDLDLLIVDEEQHFGVRHKERLKELKAQVHVLTLTATPIPRTLQMALTGLREMSIIATPPVDRLAVRTFVSPFDPLIVREALLREHYRGGQSFVVCPRIADLPEMEQFLREEVPEIRYRVAHGRMAAKALDDVMTAFYEGQFDVLLCTTIIESGLDIPTVNTLVVHRADRFGLSQLYQLRGRIGRSKVRGYAYFTVPANRTITKNAEKRLRVLQSLDELGAGFTLASHDMDIRGAGNLLGEEQSGHIKEVGVELFQHMLEEAVANARAAGGEAAPLAEEFSPQINLGIAVLIPENYVPDLDVRLGLYRRLAHIANREELDSIAAELIDRFGPLPEAVKSLLKTIEIKLACHAARIEKIDAGPKGATLTFRDNHFPNPAGLVEFISGHHGTAKLRPDHKLVIRRDWNDDAERLDGIEHLAKSLARVARTTPSVAASVTG